MQPDTLSPCLRQQHKLLFAREFNNLVLIFLGFYRKNRFFIIPNDLIEAVANLLGYYFADACLTGANDFQHGLVTLQDSIAVYARKGYQLAELYKVCQQNTVYELEKQGIYGHDDVNIALLILEINIQLGKLLISGNKEAVIQQPVAEVETLADSFIRQQLYPVLLQAVQQVVELEPEDKATFIIGELSIYTGWIAGFYACLLASTADLFAAYAFNCVAMAGRQQNKH